MQPLHERFDEKFIAIGSGGCWIWTGLVNRSGYGQIRAGSRKDGGLHTESAHRVAWKLYCGPIPDGKGEHGTCVCHHCDNRLCVNPAHLFLGTHSDNMTDKKKKGRVSRQYGETNRSAKLTAAQVVKIRSIGRSKPLREIAARFGVSAKQISRILRREKWGSV